MKKTSLAKGKTKHTDELLPEYHFDYKKAKPNRFAKRVRPESVAVLLDPDVAKVFETGDAVNTALRALITAMPARRSSLPR